MGLLLGKRHIAYQTAGSTVNSAISCPLEMALIGGGIPAGFFHLAGLHIAGENEKIEGHWYKNIPKYLDKNGAKQGGTKVSKAFYMVGSAVGLPSTLITLNGCAIFAPISFVAFAGTTSTYRCARMLRDRHKLKNADSLGDFEYNKYLTRSPFLKKRGIAENTKKH
jgi:hypothetical protein